MWKNIDCRLWATPPGADDPDDPSQMVDVCEQIETVGRRIDLLTGIETLTVRIQKPSGEKIFDIPRELIGGRRMFQPLAAQGLSIFENDTTAKILQEVLFDTEEDAPVIFTHENHGFCNLNSAECFLWNRPLGVSNPHAEFRYIGSTACGDLRPRGSPETWRKMLINEVVRSPPLILALLLGMTASVTYRLKQCGLFTELPVWALIGPSSTGKTTALVLAASAWAAPLAMIEHCNATSNAISALLAQNVGTPLLLDEATYSPGFSWDDLLYEVPAGKERFRCKPNGSLKKTHLFNGAVLFTSERSIFERSMQTNGERARIVEFTCDWFDDGVKAERIKAFCSKNYGHAVEPVIQLLLNPIVCKKLAKRFRHEYRRMLGEMSKRLLPTDGVSRRLAQRGALILTAGWVMQKAVKVGMNLDKVRELLLQQFSENIEDPNKPQDLATELHELVRGYALLHASQFPNIRNLSSKTALYASSNLKGARGWQGASQCLWIEAETFRIIASSKPGIGLRTACRTLEDAGLLVRFGDRYVKDVQLGPLVAPCYCILKPNDTSAVAVVEESKDIRDAEQALAEDPLGLLSQYVSPKLPAKTPMILGFIALSAQRTVMRINKALKAALKIKPGEHFFMTPLLTEGLLMLSKTRLVDDSISLASERYYDGLRSESFVFNLILDMFECKVDVFHRFLFWDVEISESHGGVAVIRMTNAHGRWAGKTSPSDPLKVDDIMETKEATETVSENRKYLLSDDGEED